MLSCVKYKYKPADRVPVVGWPFAGPSIGLPEMSFDRDRSPEGGEGSYRSN